MRNDYRDLVEIFEENAAVHIDPRKKIVGMNVIPRNIEYESIMDLLNEALFYLDPPEFYKDILEDAVSEILGRNPDLPASILLKEYIEKLRYFSDIAKGYNAKERFEVSAYIVEWVLTNYLGNKIFIWEDELQ